MDVEVGLIYPQAVISHLSYIGIGLDRIIIADVMINYHFLFSVMQILCERLILF